MPKGKNKPPNFPVTRQPAHLPETRQRLVKVTYEAPLPPPGMLAEYERVLPGLSDRLVKRMEEQSDHRQGLENRKMDADIGAEKRGQIFAFILAAMAIIASFILLWNGKNTQGIILFITTFASLVSVFIVGKVKQSKDLARRRREMREMLPKKEDESGK